jgi:hypothetical protein
MGAWTLHGSMQVTCKNSLIEYSSLLQVEILTAVSISKNNTSEQEHCMEACM